MCPTYGSETAMSVVEGEIMVFLASWLEPYTRATLPVKQGRLYNFLFPGRYGRLVLVIHHPVPPESAGSSDGSSSPVVPSRTLPVQKCGLLGAGCRVCCDVGCCSVVDKVNVVIVHDITLDKRYV